MSHPAEESSHAHINADTNQGPEAIHHTLGPGADQSSPGNHYHKYLLNIGVFPTASSTNEGQTYLVLGGSGVADVLYVCLKSSTDTYSWKVVATG